MLRDILIYGAVCLGLLLLGGAVGLIPTERLHPETRRRLIGYGLVASGIAIAPVAHRAFFQYDDYLLALVAIFLLIGAWSVLRPPASR